MKRLEFLKRFGKAVVAFSDRGCLKDELGAFVEAKRANLPNKFILPHPDVVSWLILAARSPELIPVAAERAYRATLPWWVRKLA